MEELKLEDILLKGWDLWLGGIPGMEGYGYNHFMLMMNVVWFQAFCTIQGLWAFWVGFGG